jgi:hypothetical protein
MRASSHTAVADAHSLQSQRPSTGQEKRPGKLLSPAQQSVLNTCASGYWWQQVGTTVAGAFAALGAVAHQKRNYPARNALLAVAAVPAAMGVIGWDVASVHKPRVQKEIPNSPQTLPPRQRDRTWVPEAMGWGVAGLGAIVSGLTMLVQRHDAQLHYNTYKGMQYGMMEPPRVGKRPGDHFRWLPTGAQHWLERTAKLGQHPHRIFALKGAMAGAGSVAAGVAGVAAFSMAHRRAMVDGWQDAQQECLTPPVAKHR